MVLMMVSQSKPAIDLACKMYLPGFRRWLKNVARLRVVLRICVTAVEFNGVWFDDHSARESGLLSFSLLPWGFFRRCVLFLGFHGDNFNLDFNYRVFLGESLILRHFFLDDVWMQLS